MLDKDTYDKLYKDVPTYMLITPSHVSERLKVNKSLLETHLFYANIMGLTKCVRFVVKKVEIYILKQHL